jgi:diphthamide biosynthesis protein 2
MLTPFVLLIKDFFRPIITPYELEVALQAEQNWTSRYILDFDKLLSENTVEHTNGMYNFYCGHLSIDNAMEAGHASDEDPDRPIFSTITGKYRQAKRYGGTL